ncbi:MAG: pseudaminic acid biosynthesis-associated methylase [Verrucomicrobiota bacterium]
MSSNPLDEWKTEFGDDYMKRNQPEAKSVKQAAEVFSRIFKQGGLEGNIKNALEVGANLGINLRGIQSIYSSADLKLSAVEPNGVALKAIAEDSTLELEQCYHCSGQNIPCDDGVFDLVFTNGVLIHVPPSDLEQVISEIVRSSSRYILCSEYFSHEPIEISYHSNSEMLWKRDFGKKYLECFPELKVVNYGFIWMEEFSQFDNLNWWLFEK